MPCFILENEKKKKPVLPTGTNYRNMLWLILKRLHILEAKYVLNLRWLTPARLLRRWHFKSDLLPSVFEQPCSSSFSPARNIVISSHGHDFGWDGWKDIIPACKQRRSCCVFDQRPPTFPPYFKVLCPISHTQGGNIKFVRLLFMEVETDFYITAAQPFAVTQLLTSP